MRDADKGQTWQQMQDELVHPCGGEAKLTDGELLELYKLAVKTIIDLKSKLATATSQRAMELKIAEARMEAVEHMLYASGRLPQLAQDYLDGLRAAVERLRGAK